MGEDHAAQITRAWIIAIAREQPVGDLFSGTRLSTRVRYYRSFEFLIIDEFGFDKLERREYPESLTLLYKVVAARNGRGSTAFITNVDFSQWTDYLGDPPLATVRPDWIYKKCDSVLRGHVRVELEATMAVFAMQRALLIPANPSRGRIIRDGEYFVNGQPLHESEFARDPEHQRTTASITELLGGDLSDITTPDVESEADVALQAAKIDAETLNAGGADFFVLY